MTANDDTLREVTVDVFYEGFVLGKGLPAREDQGRIFVEMAQPMPVGTWLTIFEGGHEESTRVVAVTEGVIPGVWLKKTVPEANAPAPDTVTEGDPTAPQKPAPKDRRSRPRRNVHGK